MIPHEVKCIAEELAVNDGKSEDEWMDYTTLAWQIYNRLEAEERALLCGDY